MLPNNSLIPIARSSNLRFMQYTFQAPVVIHSFIHFFNPYSLTTGPYLLPKRGLPRVRSSATSFSFHYPLCPSRSSSSSLHLLPRLTVTRILCGDTPQAYHRPFLWPSSTPSRIKADQSQNSLFWPITGYYLYCCTVHLVDSLIITQPTNALIVCHLF